MSTHTILRCDVCGGVIADGGRRFIFSGTLSVMNGGAHSIDAQAQDICSEQCLYASLRGLVEKVAITQKEETNGR